MDRERIVPLRGIPSLIMDPALLSTGVELTWLVFGKGYRVRGRLYGSILERTPFLAYIPG